MGTDKKITPSQVAPAPVPTTEQGTPFKAYSAPTTQGAAADADGAKN